MKKQSVLVVEDNGIEALYTSEILEEAGYEVAARVGSGEDALEYTSTRQPDLILMDIQLNGKIDGICTAERIQEKFQVPIIFLTAHTDEKTFHQAKNTEPYGYVSKPYVSKELLIAIELALQQFDINQQLQNNNSVYHEVTRLVSGLSYLFNVSANGGLENEWVDIESLSKITKYSRQEINEQKDWKSLIHPQDLDLINQHLQRLISGENDSVKFRIVTKEGDSIWLRGVSQCMWDDEKKRVIKIVGAAKRIVPEPLPDNRQIDIKINRLRNFVFQSKVMRDIEKDLLKLSKSNANVFIFGESGTGKELVARSLHQNSKRVHEPFIPLDCVSLPASLLESEIFGFEKGSFTGAIRSKPGVFELANKGTLFLDEITELDLFLQAKLLRVLQERQIRRIGGKDLVDVDVRIISATNRSPEEAVLDRKLREDLYYRLNVVPINIPPLRERKEDIPLLVYHFINKYLPFASSEVKGISGKAMRCLQDYHWPGNVRELENVIHRALSLTENGMLELEDLPENLTDKGKDPLEEINIDITYKEAKAIILKKFSRRYFTELLTKYDGNLSRVAQGAGISRVNLYRLIDEYQIQR